MNPADKCPPPRMLAAYENGALDDAQAESTQQHLESCLQCRKTMARIRSGNKEASTLREVLGDSLEDQLAEFAAGSSAASQLGSMEMSVSGAENSTWLVPDYEPIKLCGEGSYGAVWAVRDRVGVYRALKIIDVKKVAGPSAGCRERVALETYCKKVSRHPHLITVYHVGMVGDHLYYTMDLADDYRTHKAVAGELAENYRPFILRNVMMKQPLKPDVALEIVRRLLGGLVELHEQGLVHRDIKPTNIVFVRKAPRLADIGMVAVGKDSKAIVGTPRYMPPDRIIDETADTYAMGKILHELLSGRDSSELYPKLPQESLAASMKWDMDGVAEVIRRSSSERAVDRYQNATEMLDALEACGEMAFHSLFDGIRSDEAVSSRQPGTSVPIWGRIAIASVNALPKVLVLILLIILVLKFL